jgi:hypothetical protein
MTPPFRMTGTKGMEGSEADSKRSLHSLKTLLGVCGCVEKGVLWLSKMGCWPSSRPSIRPAELRLVLLCLPLTLLLFVPSLTSVMPCHSSLKLQNIII